MLPGIDGFSIVKNLRSMKVRTPVTVMKASLDMLEREEIHSKYLDLKEGDEVVECDLIIICEHEIAVGRMKELGYNKSIDFEAQKKSF